MPPLSLIELLFSAGGRKGVGSTCSDYVIGQMEGAVIGSNLAQNGAVLKFHISILLEIIIFGHS